MNGLANYDAADGEYKGGGPARVCFADGRELQVVLVAGVNPKAFCAICGCLPQRANLMRCGNILCDRCVGRYTFLMERPCPCGRGGTWECGNPFRYQLEERQIEELMVECPNLPEGCEVFIPLMDLHRHLRECTKGPVPVPSGYDRQLFECVVSMVENVCLALNVGLERDLETNEDQLLAFIDTPRQSQSIRAPEESTMVLSDVCSVTAEDLGGKALPIVHDAVLDGTGAAPDAKGKLLKKDKRGGKVTNGTVNCNKPLKTSPQGHGHRLKEIEVLYTDEGVLKLLESGVSGRTRGARKNIEQAPMPSEAKPAHPSELPQVHEVNVEQMFTKADLAPKVIVERIAQDIIPQGSGLRPSKKQGDKRGLARELQALLAAQEESGDSKLVSSTRRDKSSGSVQVDGKDESVQHDARKPKANSRKSIGCKTADPPAEIAQQEDLHSEDCAIEHNVINRRQQRGRSRTRRTLQLSHDKTLGDGASRRTRSNDTSSSERIHTDAVRSDALSKTEEISDLAVAAATDEMLSPVELRSLRRVRSRSQAPRVQSLVERDEAANGTNAECSDANNLTMRRGRTKSRVACRVSGTASAEQRQDLNEEVPFERTNLDVTANTTSAKQSTDKEVIPTKVDKTNPASTEQSATDATSADVVSLIGPTTVAPSKSARDSAANRYDAIEGGSTAVSTSTVTSDAELSPPRARRKQRTFAAVRGSTVSQASLIELSSTEDRTGDSIENNRDKSATRKVRAQQETRIKSLPTQTSDLQRIPTRAGNSNNGDDTDVGITTGVDKSTIVDSKHGNVPSSTGQVAPKGEADTLSLPEVASSKPTTPTAMSSRKRNRDLANVELETKSQLKLSSGPPRDPRTSRSAGSTTSSHLQGKTQLMDVCSPKASVTTQRDEPLEKLAAAPPMTSEVKSIKDPQMANSVPSTDAHNMVDPRTTGSDNTKHNVFRIPRKSSGEIAHHLESPIALGNPGSTEAMSWQPHFHHQHQKPVQADGLHWASRKRERSNRWLSPGSSESSGSRASRKEEMWPLGGRSEDMHGKRSSLTLPEIPPIVTDAAHPKRELIQDQDLSVSVEGTKDRPYSPKPKRRYRSPSCGTYPRSGSSHPALTHEHRSRSRARYMEESMYTFSGADERVPRIYPPSNEGPSCSRDYYVSSRFYPEHQDRRNTFAQERDQYVYDERLVRESTAPFRGQLYDAPVHRPIDQAPAPDSLCREIPIEPRMVIRLPERKPSVRPIRCVIELPCPTFLPDGQEEPPVTEKESIQEVTQLREPANFDRRLVNRDPRFKRRSAPVEAPGNRLHINGNLGTRVSDISSGTTITERTGPSGLTYTEMIQSIETVLRKLGHQHKEHSLYTQWSREYSNCRSEDERRAIVTRYWRNFVSVDRHRNRPERHQIWEGGAFHDGPKLPPRIPPQLTRTITGAGFWRSPTQDDVVAGKPGAHSSTAGSTSQYSHPTLQGNLAPHQIVLPHHAQNQYVVDPFIMASPSCQVFVSRGRPADSRAALFQLDDDGSRFSDEDHDDEPGGAGTVSPANDGESGFNDRRRQRFRERSKSRDSSQGWSSSGKAYYQARQDHRPRY